MLNLDTPAGPAPEVAARIPEIIAEWEKRGNSAHVILDATVSDLAPSVNKLYLAGRFGQRYKNPKAVAFGNTLQADVNRTYSNRLPFVPQDKQLHFRLICYYPFPKVNKRKGVGKDYLVGCDADNRLKVALDATAHLLGFNDNQVYDVVASKRRGVPGLLALYPGGYCRVTLTVIGDL